jgi:HD-like signal output (HDOD) protein
MAETSRDVDLECAEPERGGSLASTVDELQQIKEALASLQKQVEILADQDSPPAAVPAAGPTPQEPAPPLPVEEPAAVPAPESVPPLAPEDPPAAHSLVEGVRRGAVEHDPLPLLRVGMAELADLGEAKQVPAYFARLAQRLGLRYLLLKRWRTGLQVLKAVNISPPEEACRKRRDGRAPIPLDEDAFFQAMSDDGSIYAGPVPAKHFPIDLTLILGRGSRDRQIVVVPVPIRDHWNTYVYLDADRGNERGLALAEMLARYALARVLLLAHNAGGSGRRVAAILKEELARRRERQAQRLRGAGLTGADLEGPITAKEPSPAPAAPPDSGSVPESRGEEPLGQPAGSTAQRTPQSLLQHTGELPALPRAACHILAVIEDPKTTATRLEKAIAMDQALTAKVLRIANSPFYGAVRDIKTVSEAIVRLGFVTIRNWTLVTATKSVFLTPGTAPLYQRIWRQSLLSALSSQLVAQAVQHLEPEAVFLGGLMQNIGQLVLARAEPELFQEVIELSVERGCAYHLVERELLGFDHGELGAHLIREWNLSRQLEEAVRVHHRLEEESSERRVAAMIALGEELAACTSSQEPSETLWEDSEAARILGVGAELYGELKSQAQQISIDPQFFS